MGQSQDIKIRALPRKSRKEKDAAAKTEAATVPRWIIYVGTTCVVLLVGAFFLPNIKAGSRARVASGSSDMTSATPMADAVTRHLRESQIHQQMLRSRSKLENLRAMQTDSDLDQAMLNDDGRTYGVQMDSEDTPERLFKELNDRQPSGLGDNLPEDRIANRLANRKWVSEMERADRVLFIRNFIRSAYDKGYTVDIDQNLVVVGVHKITGEKKVNIDQVIDRMAKQGL